MRVVRPEFEPALFAEAPSISEPKIVGSTPPPVEPGRFDDKRQLVRIEVNSRGEGGQSSVDIGRTEVEATPCGLTGGGEHRNRWPSSAADDRRGSAERLHYLFDRVSSE